MGGIFDWLRRQLPGGRVFEAFGPRTGLPALPPPPPGLPAAPPPSGEIAVPPVTPATLPGIMRIFEAFGPPAAPPAPPELPQIFEFIRPGPPAPPPPTPEEAAMSWRKMFPPEKQPLTAMFARPEVAARPPMAWIPPEAVPEAMEWMREFPDIAERTGGRIPLWVLLNMGWEPPNTMQLMEGIRRGWNLPEIFDTVLTNTDTPWWHDWVRTAISEPATLEIDAVTPETPGPYSDLGAFLGVPDHVILAYARQPEGDRLLWEEVLGPLTTRITRALDILKPAGLRGWFDLVPMVTKADQPPQYWLVYKEAPFRPPAM